MRDSTEVRYARQGDMVRLKLDGLTNHELREVLVGLWSRLDRADQEDHIRELQEYLKPESWLSPVAQSIRDGDGANGVIDVSTLMRQEFTEGQST